MSKRKHSIFKQITGVFCVAILLASVIAGIVSFVYNTRQIAQRSTRYASTGAAMAAQAIESVDFDSLKRSDTDELYTNTRSTLRNICKSFELEYLYLYVPDTEEDRIRFIMTVASDEEKDKIVATERGLDVSVPLELNEQQQAALKGEEYGKAYIEDNKFGKVYSWCYPVRDDGGNVIALIGADYRTDRILWQEIKGTLLIILPMIIILLLILLFDMFVMYRKVFAPIKLLSDRMNSFVSDGGANLEPLQIRSGDEIQEIADSFEKMSQDIGDYLEHIETLTTERVQANVELEVANRIQCGIVPSETVLKDDTYDVYAYAQPAKEVGGDFYDCFVREDGSVCIVIGDVSGKGVAAAMFMVMAKTMLRDCLSGGAAPGDALNRVNDALCSSNPEGMFATIFAAVLAPDSGMLCYANAGHTRPLLLGKPVKNLDGSSVSRGHNMTASTEFLQMDSGIAVGLFEDADIREDTVWLEKNQGILLYTDGVTEAVNPQKEFFGEERLLLAVETAGDAEQVLHMLTETITSFAEGARQFDDYTALALYYSGSSRETYRLEPELSSLSKLKEILNVAGSDASGRKTYLACEEAFVNIVNYSGAATVELSLSKQTDRLIVEFADDGNSFDPFAKETLAEEKEFEELDSGGMGIGLIQQLTETREYKRVGDKNILTLGFLLDAHE